MAKQDQAYVRDASDKRQVAAARRAEEKRETQFIDSLRAVLKTREGRRVLGELLERAGLYRSSFDHSGSVTFFNEGRRNFGLEIQANVVEAGEDLYLEMEREMRAFKRSLMQGPAAVQMDAVRTETGETDGDND